MKKFMTNQSNYLLATTLFFVIIVFSLSALFRYVCINVSIEYLTRAKKEISIENKVIYLETATMLYPSEDNLLITGNTLAEYGDYGAAIKYLSRLTTDNSRKSLASAYYLDSKYDQAIHLSSKFEVTDEKMYILHIKSLLSLGNVVDAREVLNNEYFNNAELAKLRELTATSSPDTVLTRYDALISLGFPQSAFSILREAYKSNDFSRDALITLANLELQEGRSELAYLYLQEAVKKDMYYPQTYRQLIEVGQKLGKDVVEYQKRLTEITW